MDEHSIIRSFDGRETSDVSFSGFNFGNVWQIIEIAYEFGYQLTGVSHRRTSIRFSFRRDDSGIARARASWAHGYYRVHGTWARPVPSVRLTPSLGARIDHRQAAHARYDLAFARDRGWVLQIAGVLAALLAVACWRFREEVAILLPLLGVGGVLVVGVALTPFVTLKRHQRLERTVEMYELQQAVERGFMPPPPSPDVGECKE
ncbi:hypothetical protein [Streptomyces synnematoformans]|uniref:DUF2812 domain-containing protein n=1 Tax=Streptomyces synnematoformans TaxID=415721 RepID=A0ABN2X9U6_9ACTN